jgi:DNA polymerase IV
MKTIFHIDMDAFFVSVERILDPSLEGKPVIVGGDPHGRGVVAACSYEARKFGLHSAMPIKNAYRLCPQGVYLHGHYKEYVRYSHAVKNFLEKKLPLVQQASVDEFYFDFTGCEKIYGTAVEFAAYLQKEIGKQFSLPCSIGIASNKTIVKIASDFKKPMGITYVPAGTEKEFLAPLPIERVPGVGKKTCPILRARGFKTVGDLANSSADYLATLLGKFGTDLWEKANGYGNDVLSQEHDRKSISKETTFEEDIVSKPRIESYIFEMSGSVGQSIRNENWQALTISIKLRYSDFETITRAKTLARPTDDDKIIFETARDLFRKAFTRRVGIRLIGIHLSKLNQFFEQEVLFEDEDAVRKRMLRAIMKIRDKFGYSAIQIGKTGKD